MTQIGTLKTIEAELQALVDHISEFRKALNVEGVWLFLTTLGCWSVTQPFLQSFAFAMSVYLFGQRITERTKDTRSFSKLVKSLEARIAELAESESQRKAGLYDLLLIQKKELSGFTPFRQVHSFMVCWLFWGLSLGYCVLINWPKR